MRFCVFTMLLLLSCWLAAAGAHAQAATEEALSFESGDVRLHGTMLVPEQSGRVPAVVLVHGAGPGKRDENRPIAEALAREGFLTLIYDKRTQGYSANPAGDRSYSLLADDAVAAVQMLQQRDEVNPAQVGLWGLSEGGWVAPLAATRSTDIAFVITVAGGGVGPAEQSAWATEGALRRQGVTSEGSLRALADHTYRFLISAELFAEGTYDPAPVLEQLRQPVLALWGSLDRVMPAAKSARVMRRALARGGHRHYVLRFISDASHDASAVAENQVTGAPAPGYVETMTSWLRNVTADAPPGPHLDASPADGHPTRPSVTDVQGFARWQVQLAFFAFFQLVFGGYLVAAGVRYLRRAKPQRMPGRWSTWVLTVLGLVTPWGVYAYTGYVAATSGEGVTSVIAGRPVGWFLLQLLAFALLLTAVLLTATWYRGRQSVQGVERVWLALLMGGAMLFVPWAFWWQLFSL